MEEFPLKKTDEAAPLYIRLKNALHEQIETGLLKPGQMIPSERGLCREYGISRITVRRCISEMVHEEILCRRHGKGTFVAVRKIKQGLARIVDFKRTVLELGMDPSTSILSSERTTADTPAAKVLGLPAAAPVVRLSLLGKGNEEPLVLYESSFPPDIGEKIVREALKREKERIPFSTYDLYGEPSGIYPGMVNQTFEAIVADERLSGIMRVKKGAPLLRITSIFMNGEQRPLEFRKATYRGDRYKFHILRDFSAK
jgi:GntR family transcriptional regulator